jgi:hypothetical protein
VNFTKELVEMTFTDSYRKFQLIHLKDNLYLSVQASMFHHSKPTETIDDLNEYTHWEIALFDDEKLLRIAEVLPTFRSLAEVELYWGEVYYGYVPTDLVEEVYLALK